ncbi:hypothetical protein [Pseudoxanthomonas putridarboris]|uniref:Uncharacterized protein n=1 Tax=Pseudoxanthomonas putridarboris TaxID=752605 RepID=A0ABU9J337_9GAMM
MRRLAALLALAASSASVTHARAQEAACEASPAEQAGNRDGSTLSLRTECPAGATRRYIVELRCADGRQCDTLEIEQDIEESPTGHASLVDIDGDGMHEVEVRGMCGAGPNCEGDLYRIDRDGRTLYHFFSGGYADVRIIDGHIVESGRASCCSWEHHAWPLDEDGRLHGDGPMALMVTIGADFASERDDAPPRCTFSRPSGDNRQVVAPPGAAWLSLCEVYGDDYHLVTPEEARAADAAAAQEQ